MGAWRELDTEISAEVDTSDLDKLMSLSDEFGVFAEVKTWANNVKKAVEQGTDDGVKDLARRDKSFQEQIISEKCENPSGMLASSIDYRETGQYTYLIGTRLNHIYPMALEYGRKEVYPIKAKALAFYYKGELIFRKKVGRANARPFVAPAYKKVDSLAENIMISKIGVQLKKVI